MSLWQKSRSKVASWFLKERFRSQQKSLALIGCCKIISRAISVVIFFFLVRMYRLAARIGVGVRSIPNGSFGWGGLMLQDPKPPMNPKETSLMTHPDAPMKMYDINKKHIMNDTALAQSYISPKRCFSTSIKTGLNFFSNWHWLIHTAV